MTKIKVYSRIRKEENVFLFRQDMRTVSGTLQKS